MRPSCLLLFAIAAACLPTQAADEPGLEAPPGFRVSLYAGDDLAHDIYSMTVNAGGRVVVSGPGYVKVLLDEDGDGRADGARLFSSLPASGAHGMYFDGPDLICTGDNAVLRQRDQDGDGVADGPAEIWAPLRNSEHGANGLVRGPDGNYWLICGNDAGVSERQAAAAASPIKHPRCGAVVRFSPTGKPLDVYADGFRNPYDLDFNAAGQVFTVDADGERDYHLPWYAPTRLFDIAQGREHGWLLHGWTRSWNRPQSYFDSVERLAELGRGSPTGLVVYRHNQFPSQYQGGVFSACWTLGKVYYLPLKQDGASYSSSPEVFLRTSGDVGFAPCDLAVGPKGDLFVAIGGRGTRGSVFRVSYDRPKPIPPGRDSMREVLTTPQPLSSWSRAVWVPAAEELGAAAFEQTALNDRRSTTERVRAIEILVELFGGVDPLSAQGLVENGPPAVKARLAWAIATHAGDARSQRLLAQLTADPDAAVQRAAWQGLAMLPMIEADARPTLAWPSALASPERRVRTAAIQLARGAGRQSYARYRKSRLPTDDDHRVRLADLWIERVTEDSLQVVADTPFIDECVSVISQSAEADVALEAVRLLQIGLGDLRVQPGRQEVFCGYQANLAAQLPADLRTKIVENVAAMLPARNAELNRESWRLLGMLAADAPGLLDKLSARWSAKSSCEDDIHYLIVAALLPGERPSEFTRASARALLDLQKKLSDLGEQPSQNWPQRVGEMFTELVARDDKLLGAMLTDPAFGRAEHTLFAARMSGEQRSAAIGKLLEQASTGEAKATPELIGLLGELTGAAPLAFLREQWDEYALRDSIAVVLARQPQEADRERLLAGLASAQPAVVESCAAALATLAAAASSAELLPVMAALQQACEGPAEGGPRMAIAQLLGRWTSEKISVKETSRGSPRERYEPWFKWFAETYPERAKVLSGLSTGDADAWSQRLSEIDWAAGDSERGKGVFELRSCHRCHRASGQLGPDLKGVAARLSRDDLFTAIIDPNKQVSPAFQTTQVITESGQVYNGLVVYQSPESTLLQTGPDTTLRIAGRQLASVRKSRQSLMPTGLLNGLADRDLADLYAYLKSLGAK